MAEEEEEEEDYAEEEFFGEESLGSAPPTPVRSSAAAAGAAAAGAAAPGNEPLEESLDSAPPTPVRPAAVAAAAAAAAPAAAAAAPAVSDKENASPQVARTPPPPAKEFSAADTDLESLFQKTTAVSSATAQRGPRKPAGAGLKPKGGSAENKPAPGSTPRSKPPRVKPPPEPAAAVDGDGLDSPMPSVDFTAIENDEAAIDRELMRLNHELRAMSRPKSSVPARTDSGFVPKDRGHKIVPRSRRASSAGGAQRRPRSASAAGSADKELDDELARLQAELKQLDRSKSEGEPIGAVRVPRPRSALESAPALSDGTQGALRPISSAPGQPRRRKRSAFAAPQMLRHPPRRKSAGPGSAPMAMPMGPGWNTTPVDRGANDLRPIVLVGCDPHADQEIQMRNRLLGAAAKPRRLPAFTDSGLANAGDRSGLPALENGLLDNADDEFAGAEAGISNGKKKDQEKVDYAEAVTQTTSHDRVTNEGILTVKIVQASGLLNADAHGGGSDPYVRVGMGGQEYATAINRDVEFNIGIRGHLCEWNETFNLRVSQPHDTLELEIYDYDQGDEDDLLGGVMIPPYLFPPVGEEKQTWFKVQTPNQMHMRPAKEVMSERERNEECQNGCISLVLKYIPSIWLTPSRGVRTKALDLMQSDAQAKAQWQPYGQIHVRIVEAKGLPKLKQLKNTNPFAVISYGGRFEQTPVVVQSTKPHWDAVFSFHVFELRRGLTIEVFDFDKIKEETGQYDRLGTASFSVADELDGNKRADSWLTLWDQAPKTEVPIQRGSLRVRLEYVPLWKQGGRKAHADAAGGWPERMTAEAATILLTIPKAVGLLPAVPARRAGREHDTQRDSESDEEAGEAPGSPRTRKPTNVESDTYCQVSIFTKSGDLQGTLRTETVTSTLTPEYSTELPLQIPISDPQEIVRVDCFHETRRGRPDLHLGGFFLPVAFAMRSGTLWHDEREGHWFRLEDEDALTYSIGAKPPAAVLVDGELSRQYNCPRGAMLLRKTFGLEKMEEGMDIGVGRLTVTILRAKKLPDIKRKKNHAPDAFGVLSYDALQFETEIVKRSRKPVWGQEFSFPITDIRSSFNVSLFDNGLTGDHELLGTVSVGINEVLRNSALDQQPWYKIFRTNEYGRLRPNGEVQLKLHYKANVRTPGMSKIPTVAAPRTVRSTMRTMRQMRRQIGAMRDAKPKAIVVELTEEEKQAKKEAGALASIMLMQSSPSSPPQVSPGKRDDSGSIQLYVERARGLPTFTVCYCRASIESADGTVVGDVVKSIEWSSLSDDDDAVFKWKSDLTMTSAEDYLRLQIVGVQASRQAQLAAAGDHQGAKDAPMVHGDDADKAPAAEQPVCGFRVLLSTLKNVEGDTARWYKMAAPEDLMQAGAVECGQKDETTHGMMLFAAKQTWNKKSMRSRLFAVLNG